MERRPAWPSPWGPGAASRGSAALRAASRTARAGGPHQRRRENIAQHRGARDAAQDSGSRLVRDDLGTGRRSDRRHRSTASWIMAARGKLSPSVSPSGLSCDRARFRGNGRSAHIVKGDCYYGLDFVADVDALVRTVVPEPVVLVGHSMGGAISVMFASARRELVRG